jgi:hydrogenase maturation protein HypF
MVASLAARLGLAGWVRNDDDGLVVEVEGVSLEPFFAELRRGPPGARIDAFAVEARPVEGSTGFSIAPSRKGGAASPSLGADVAPCADCLAELFDPGGRRYRYALLSCARCGPRDSVALGLPWDRGRTTLAAFPLCAACAAEHDDPFDRRFHAQSMACPACGPAVLAPLDEAVAALDRGVVVALKAVGGYQLLCRADDPAAVARLRERKGRGDKPFAVMVRNVESAAELVFLDELGRAALTSARRPILLARARQALPGVAPGLDQLGVTLPSSPLHYLLLHALAGQPTGTRWLEEPDPTALVVTSANRAGEPLWGDAERGRLPGMAEVVLTHDRPIAQRSDDSVVHIVEGAARLLRRARGWTPEAIPMDGDGVLALGADQKCTVSLLHRGQLCTSPHLGDLDHPDTLDLLRAAVDRLCDTLGARPRLVVHDLHPDFASTRHAQALGLPTQAVQHHHAHVMAVLAEHRHRGPALGIVLDGYGYGADGGAWGGELLEVDGPRCARVGHLAELPLPGGDAAAREPWRMAVAALYQLGRKEEALRRWGEPAARVWALCERGLAPPTSSGGRAFDAAAALAGLGDRARFEGELAMRLQARVRRPRVMDLPVAPVLDLSPLYAALADSQDPGDAADLFHGTLARALVGWARYSEAPVVVLGGGCFANPVLTALVAEGLRREGREPLLARRFPPNDGAISVGQAAIAAWT